MTAFAANLEQRKEARCPTLAAFLFLRLGWDISNLSQRSVQSLGGLRNDTLY